MMSKGMFPTVYAARILLFYHPDDSDDLRLQLGFVEGIQVAPDVVNGYRHRSNEQELCKRDQNRVHILIYIQTVLHAGE